METLSFLRFSTVSVSRNRRRSLYAIVGIALSTSLFAASVIAVGTSATSLLNSTVGPTTVDFVCDNYVLSSYGYNASMALNDTKAIKQVPGVQEVSDWMTVSDWSMTNTAGQQFLSYAGGVYLAFVSPSTQFFLEKNRVHGDFPAPGTVAISKSAADSLGVGVGGKIVCSLSEYDVIVNPDSGARNYSLYYLNLTFPVSQIWTQDKVPNGYAAGRPDLLDPNVVYLNGRTGVQPVVFNMESYQAVMNSTVLDSIYAHEGPEPKFSYLVWINRGSVIDLSNLDHSVDQLHFIQTRLNTVGQKRGFSAQDTPLENELISLKGTVNSMEATFLELSVPVAALGVYLSFIGVDMGTNSRRREAGLLMARGASRKLVLGYLIVESMILGALAALFGLFAGASVSWMLFRSFGSASASTAVPSSFTAFSGIGPSTIELAVAFGVVLMLLSSYRTFLKLSGVSVRGAIRHYSPDMARDDYSSVGDIVLILFAALSIGSVLLTANFVNSHGWSWITKLAVGFLIAWGMMLFPFMPFLLSFGVVRIITRGWKRLYRSFSWFVRPWTGNLHYLVEKNIMRNPRRASNLGVLISLALASGLFVSITMESTVANQKNQVVFDIGSDLRLDGQWYGNLLSPGRTLDLAALQDVGGVHGVRSSVPYMVLSIKPYPFANGTELRAAVMNCSAFDALARPSHSLFVRGGIRSLTGLVENGTVAISQHTASVTYLQEGDELQFAFSYDHWENAVLKTTLLEFPLTVKGIYTVLPGLAGTDMVVSERTMSWLTTMNISAAPFRAGAFVALSRGADPNEVANAAASILTGAGFDTTANVAANGLAALEQARGFSTMRDFLYMEYILSVAIMSVGVGLLVFVSVEDRERELACTMARGVSGRQMRRMLMGESFTLMLLGLSVGVSIGLVASFLYNTMPPSAASVQKTMMFTSLSWIMLGASIVSLVVASYLATAMAGKLRVAEVLRVRGG